MKMLGILCVKHNSKRLPFKNLLDVHGKALWKHAYDAMCECPEIDGIMVCSDVEQIIEIAKSNGCQTCLHPTVEEDSILNIMRYAFYETTGRQSYDAICTVFACSVGNMSYHIGQAHDMLNTGHFQEVRGFNRSNGHETGLMAFTKDRFLNGAYGTGGISSYIGAVINDAIEVHTKGDLDALYKRTTRR